MTKSDNLYNKILNSIVDRSRYVILLVIIITIFFSFGITNVEQDTSVSQFETDSEAAQAQEFIDSNFLRSEDSSDNIITVQVAQVSKDALSKSSIIETLELQKEIENSETISKTLSEDNPTLSFSSIIADNLIRQANLENPRYERPITYDDRIEAVEEASDEQLNSVIQDLTTGDRAEQSLQFLPRDYNIGDGNAEGQLILVNQKTSGSTSSQPQQDFGEEITLAQNEIQDITKEYNGDYAIFGSALLSEEIEQSFSDSGLIVGPLALIFVILALAIAYRDIVDIIIGTSGIIFVLIWTFGFMGWANIGFNQILISSPVLLIGLSIDYAIHVFMRQREKRQEDDKLSTEESMKIGLKGVGTALILVTATSAIGFLANLVSDVGPLRDFGLVSAFGIFSTLIIFSVLIPAIKVELDKLMESIGFNRRKKAFGTGNSFLSEFLKIGAKASQIAPYFVIILSLIVTCFAFYGATQVDSTFDQEQFLADEPNEVFQSLPEPFKPGEYTSKSDLQKITSLFQQEGNNAEILIRGDITDNKTLETINDAIQESDPSNNSILVLPNGDTSTRSITTEAQRISQQNENFSKIYQSSDIDGNGIPDTNLRQIYDIKQDIQKSSLLYESEGEYKALRVIIDLEPQSTNSQISSDITDVSENIEESSNGDLNATATGDPLVTNDIESSLFKTVIQGLLITLVGSLIFMIVSYRILRNSFSLGIITLVPVYLAVVWIVGTMYILDISFNSISGSITSLTIGLGIAYSIHISSRFQLELERQEEIKSAMESTLEGTGGALLGSVATTVGGFGTLAFALFPILQQFGIITGLSIVYAFLASILILPSLLVIWASHIRN